MSQLTRKSSRQDSTPCKSPAEENSESITALCDYVGFYRSGAVEENDVVLMIQDYLCQKLDANTISDILTDLEKDEKTAGLLLWGDAQNNDDNALVSSSSSSSEQEGDHDDQYKPLRAVMVSDPHANDEKAHDVATASMSLPVNRIKPLERPTTDVMVHQDASNKDELKQSEAMSIDKPSMDPPATSSGMRSIHGLADVAGSSVPSPATRLESTSFAPGTPRPNYGPLASTIGTPKYQAGVGVDQEAPHGQAAPHDREKVGPRRTSSPGEGMTTGLWGLLMPTKEARKLAYRMNLPQATIDEQVRSISPRNRRESRASFAEEVITLPTSKRKASMTLHKATSPKSPKFDGHSDLFAREGEGQVAFVLSHFDKDQIPRKFCYNCLRLPCGCESEPFPHSTSAPACPEGIQKPCVRDSLSQVDKAIQTASHNGRPSSDSPSVKLADRTGAKPPKQSVTLLAYLARALEDNNILSSIKQLELLPQSHGTVVSAKMILHHVQQGLRSDENLDATSIDDLETMRILEVIIQSSQALTEYWEKLQRKLDEEKDSTVSVDDCHDEMQEGPDPDSSSFNNSSGHENAHAPPPAPVASAAASLKRQSYGASDAASQANSTSLAKVVSPYVRTSTPNYSVPQLGPDSGIEDAAQPSRFETATAPDSSAAVDPSGAESHSSSPGGGICSTAGGHPSQAALCSEPSAGISLPTTKTSGEQVSGHPVDAGRDTDNTPVVRQPLPDPDNMSQNVGTRLSPSPRLGVRDADQNCSSPLSGSKTKQSPDTLPQELPRPSLNKLPNAPPATPKSRSRESSPDAEATPIPSFEKLPRRPPNPGVPGKAGTEWKSKTYKQALEHAKEKAFSERKTLACYLEERRDVRTRIKKENELANSKWSDHSFFQSANGVSGSSGATTTQALNKLFDKYRGTSDTLLRFA